jgi:hypothetical protein
LSASLLLSIIATLKRNQVSSFGTKIRKKKENQHERRKDVRTEYRGPMIKGLLATFPDAFSNAATISKTDVPLPVPRL